MSFCSRQAAVTPADVKEAPVCSPRKALSEHSDARVVG
jgi:hypothetical protein